MYNTITKQITKGNINYTTASLPVQCLTIVSIVFHTYMYVFSVSLQPTDISARLRPGSDNGRGSSGLIEFMNMFLW